MAFPLSVCLCVLLMSERTSCHSDNNISVGMWHHASVTCQTHVRVHRQRLSDVYSVTCWEANTSSWYIWKELLKDGESFPLSFHTPPSIHQPSQNVPDQLSAHLFRSIQLFCLSVCLCRDGFLVVGRVITFHQPCTII